MWTLHNVERRLLREFRKQLSISEGSSCWMHQKTQNTSAVDGVSPKVRYLTWPWLYSHWCFSDIHVRKHTTSSQLLCVHAFTLFNLRFMLEVWLSNLPVCVVSTVPVDGNNMDIATIKRIRYCSVGPWSSSLDDQTDFGLIIQTCYDLLCRRQKLCWSLCFLTSF